MVVLALVPFVALCLITGLFISVIGKVHVDNNQILGEYERTFRKIDHPPDTAPVTFKRLVTRPPGNGSHCFYFVGEVRSFSGDRVNIEAFYADEQIQLQFFDQAQLESLPYDWLGQRADWGIATNSNKDYYLIYTLNSRIDDYLSVDLRCQ